MAPVDVPASSVPFAPQTLEVSQSVKGATQPAPPSSQRGVQAPPAGQKKPLWQSESAAQVVQTDAPPSTVARQTPTLPLLPTHSVEDVQMQDPKEESEGLVSQVCPLTLLAQSASFAQTQVEVCVRQWLRAGLP